MTYLLGPNAMKLFFSASDDQIAFRQALDPCICLSSLLSLHDITCATQAGRQQSTSHREFLGCHQICSSHITQPCFRA